jgi:hypothetical protein
MKNIKLVPSILLSLMLLLVIISIPANAQTAPNFQKDQAITISSKGKINLRDKNCKVITTAENGDMGNLASTTPINCQIGKFKYKFYEVNLGDKKGYIKWNFIKTQNTASSTKTSSSNKIKINTTGSVNLRDKNCNVIGKVAKNKEGKKLSDKTINCQIGQVKVKFAEVEFDGKKGYIGSSFISKL